VKTCPECGESNPEGAQLCGGCGRSLFFFEVGTVLSDRYEIQGVLGSGGLGRVYRAHDRMLDETVAVKVLHPETSGSHDFARRFRSEIRLARKVRHRNVCAVHEYGEQGSLRFVAMELVEGKDLSQILRERGPLPPAEAFDVAIQVTEGLTAIHDAGVIHRDLKTPNIMRDREGVVRLLDFGIAKLMAPTGTLALTGIQKVVGTPEYMSPEQIRGEDLDARSDLYSLGIVIFEVFTGLVPFQGRTPVDTLLRQVNEPPPLYGDVAARIPPELTPVLARALSKKPGDRPTSARQLAEALREVRRAVVPEPPSAPPDRKTAARLTPPPPPVRTSILPKQGVPPVTSTRKLTTPRPPTPRPPTPPPPPPRALTPRPPARTAREDAAAAALEAGRTYVELPAASTAPPRRSAGPGRTPPPPPSASSSALPSRRPTPGKLDRLVWRPLAGLVSEVRRRPIASGLGLLALAILFVSWMVLAPGEGPPAPSASPAPAPTAGGGTPGEIASTVPLVPSPTPEPSPPEASPSPSPEAAVVPVPTPAPTVRPTPRPVRRPHPTPPPPTPTPTPSPTPTPTPTPALAVLDIDVHPWADVTIGDRPLGRTPLKALSVEPGRAVLLLQNPGFWPLRRHVMLEPGRRTSVQIDLQWEAVPRGGVALYKVPKGPRPDDPQFKVGVDHLLIGEFPEAVVTLDPVVRRLRERDRPEELARAEFFLGVALLEAGREVEARTQFERALAHDPSLRPEPAAFPARVMTFFSHVQDALEEEKR
jgi:serine/threonine protein kinase